MRLPLREGAVRGTVYDADGRHILTVHPADVDARVIVRAVNEYASVRQQRDELLDACLDLLRAFDSELLRDDQVVAVKRARRAIARAWGERA